MSYEPNAAIEQAIMSSGLPQWVVGAKPRYVEDADGDSALSVVIVIASSKPGVFKDAKKLLSIKKAVREVLKQEGVEVFPYFKFISQSDL